MSDLVDIKNMNGIDIKTAKPGIYYRVFFDKIQKIDFVRYYERTTHELTCDFGSDDYYYKKETIGCYKYKQHSNHPHWNFGLKETDCDYREHFFENLEDAQQFVIDNYYGGEIQKLKKEIEEIETKIEEFKSKTVEDKIWLT